MSTNVSDRSRRLRALGTGAGLIGAAVAPAASAATFNVTTLDDAGAGSLRQAIEDANAAAGADTITFEPGLTGTVTLTSGQLEITDSVDIQGPGAATLSVSGGNASRVFYLYNGSAELAVTISGVTITGGNANIGGGILNFDEDLTLDGVAISGNAATGDGGGLWADGFNMDLVVRNSRISGNTAGGDGGGVYVEDTGGPMLFENTVIADNQAGGQGGGIYFYDPDTAITLDRCTIAGNTAVQEGGGIYLYDTDGGPFEIRNSTISGNTASRGGGVFLYGPDNPVLLENVTVSGNVANGGNGGGMFFYSAYAGISIRQSTIAGNTSNAVGGGISLPNEEIVLVGSIVDDNTAAIDGPDLGTGKSGNFALDYSLIGNPIGASITEGAGVLLDVDAQLGPLADNGGPTQTHAPAATSPAVDAGDPAFTPPPATDQRGLPRVVNGTVDMGAVELQSSAVTLSSTTYTVAEDGGTLTVTLTRDNTSGDASVDLATTDVTATAGADYTAVTQTVTFADGVDSVTVDIAILDDALAEGDETFTITLSNPGPLTTLGAVTEATATIVDVEGGSFDFDSATYSVDEDGGNLTVNVTRSAGSTTAATVDYATADDSATAGADYTATSGTLNFAAGETTASFVVPILDDALIEGAETFDLALSNPTGGSVLGATANAVATIVDVESGGVFALSSAAYTVAEDGGSATLTVTRTAGSTTAATVDYATANGSATAGADYTATSGTLNFAAGQTSASIIVPILDDALLEDPETFSVTLANPTGGATLGAIAAATVTIEDDEVAAPGTIALAITDLAVDEADGSATLTVTRSGGSDGAVTVAYATSDGSATAPADYASTAGTLSWADGDATPRSISVPIVDDALPEPAETFTVTLSGTSGGATLGTASAQVTIAGSDPVGPTPPAQPQVIPVFGDVGRVLLGGLLAMFAWLGLRRRGGGALAVLLALGATLSTTPADAAERQRVREPARFTIATVDAVGSDIVLRAADGSTQRIAATALQVRSAPGESRGEGGVQALAVGKIVLLRTDGKGEGKHRAWVVDSAADAAALRDRKLARKAR